MYNRVRFDLMEGDILKLEHTPPSSDRAAHSVRCLQGSVESFTVLLGVPTGDANPFGEWNPRATHMGGAKRLAEGVHHPKWHSARRYAAEGSKKRTQDAARFTMCPLPPCGISNERSASR